MEDPTPSDLAEEQQQLRDRISSLEEDLVHPDSIRLVLAETALSDQKVDELVDTIEEVDQRSRGDGDV